MIAVNKTLFLKTVEINLLWLVKKKDIQFVDEYIKQFESSISENFNSKDEKEFIDLPSLYQFISNKVVDNPELREIVNIHSFIDSIMHDLGEKFRYDG